MRKSLYVCLILSALAFQLQASPRSSKDSEATEETVVEPTAEEVALIDAVRRAGGESANGSLDSVACAWARPYSEKMAAQGYQDHHQGFEERAEALGGSASEITAESWGEDLTLEEHADRCVQLWLDSPPHAESLLPYHERYCYTMALSENGRYYCEGLFSDSIPE